MTVSAILNPRSASVAQVNGVSVANNRGGFENYLDRLDTVGLSPKRASSSAARQQRGLASPLRRDGSPLADTRSGSSQGHSVQDPPLAQRDTRDVEGPLVKSGHGHKAGANAKESPPDPAPNGNDQDRHGVDQTHATDPVRPNEDSKVQEEQEAKLQSSTDDTVALVPGDSEGQPVSVQKIVTEGAGSEAQPEFPVDLRDGEASQTDPLGSEVPESETRMGSKRPEVDLLSGDAMSAKAIDVAMDEAQRVAGAEQAATSPKVGSVLRHQSEHLVAVNQESEAPENYFNVGMAEGVGTDEGESDADPQTGTNSRSIQLAPVSPRQQTDQTQAGFQSHLDQSGATIQTLGPTGVVQPVTAVHEALTAEMPVPTSEESQNDANVSRVIRGMRGVINQNGGSVTLRLNPPEMGIVRIEMQIDGSSVSARIHTELDTARSILTQQLGQLRQSLEAQGLNVDRLVVQNMASDNSPSFMTDRDADRSASDGRSRGHDMTGGHDPRGESDRGQHDGESDQQPASFDRVLNSVA